MILTWQNLTKVSNNDRFQLFVCWIQISGNYLLKPIPLLLPLSTNIENDCFTFLSLGSRIHWKPNVISCVNCFQKFKPASLFVVANPQQRPPPVEARCQPGRLNLHKFALPTSYTTMKQHGETWQRIIYKGDSREFVTHFGS